MILNRKLFFLLFLVIIIFQIDLVKAQINIKGELRPRTEYRNGYKTPRDSASIPALITSQRSRLVFSYEKEKVQTCLSIQDIRIWGETMHKNDLPSIDVHEAWAKLILSPYYSLKIGRQELKYDDQRLLSNTNWNNVNASHDIAIVKYKNSDWQVHAGLAYNNDKEKYFESNYPVNYYKTLSYLWLSKRMNENLSCSIIEITDGNEKAGSINTIYFRSTFGGNVKYQNDTAGLNFNASGYLQRGKDVTGTKIKAYFFAVKSGYLLTKNLEFSVGADYFSGNNELDTVISANNAFCTLYGSGHRFSGSMDYFTSVDKHTLGGGLTNLYGGLSYQLCQDISSQFYYHLFRLNGNKIYNNQQVNTPNTINKYLGSELDLMFNYKICNEVDIKFGYSVMFGTESLNTIKGGNYYKYADWGWIMLLFKMK